MDKTHRSYSSIQHAHIMLTNWSIIWHQSDINDIMYLLIDDHMMSLHDPWRSMMTLWRSYDPIMFPNGSWWSSLMTRWWSMMAPDDPMMAPDDPMTAPDDPWWLLMTPMMILWWLLWWSYDDSYDDSWWSYDDPMMASDDDSYDDSSWWSYDHPMMTSMILWWLLWWSYDDSSWWCAYDDPMMTSWWSMMTPDDPMMTHDDSWTSYDDIGWSMMIRYHDEPWWRHNHELYMPDAWIWSK